MIQSNGQNERENEKACLTDVSSTFTFKALLDHPPQETATVVTEGGAHVVVGLQTVRHVDLEALLLELYTYITPISSAPAC